MKQSNMVLSYACFNLKIINWVSDRAGVCIICCWKFHKIVGKISISVPNTIIPSLKLNYYISVLRLSPLWSVAAVLAPPIDSIQLWKTPGEKNEISFDLLTWNVRKSERHLDFTRVKSQSPSVYRQVFFWQVFIKYKKWWWWGYEESRHFKDRRLKTDLAFDWLLTFETQLKVELMNF